jgi:hypothetical protein
MIIGAFFIAADFSDDSKSKVLDKLVSSGI